MHSPYMYEVIVCNDPVCQIFIKIIHLYKVYKAIRQDQAIENPEIIRVKFVLLCRKNIICCF